MKTTQEKRSIGDIKELYKNKMLVANPEYQRGAVWSMRLKKKLIDSVLRGYPLPLIYLHHIKKTVAGIVREDFEVIDGQQRINALFEFSEDNFQLFDPIKDDKEAKFPAFLKSQPCPWAGKMFSDLTEDLKNVFLETQLAIANIETEEANEVRDLFVRLQSGLPLNAQETRDAWPGQFTEFILGLGGKPDIARYPGHAFFSGPMGLSPRTDRGKTRQFAAQIAMLYLTHRKSGSANLPDTNADSLNEFYFSIIDFDKSSIEAKRLKEILDKLHHILADGARPKLKAHDAIHLVLLVDTLWDDYTRSWEGKLAEALDHFTAKLAEAKNQKDTATPGEFWTRYGQWTRVNSDRGDRIAHRHAFYIEAMKEKLIPLQLKDPQRIYGQVDRELLYFKKHKKCDVCGAAVQWAELEIHHVIEHSKGGETSIENAALVHKACHPKTDVATKALADKLNPEQSNEEVARSEESDEGTDILWGFLWERGGWGVFLPHQTELRLAYKGSDYYAKVDGDAVIFKDKSVSPSGFVSTVTGSSRNAWKDIWLRMPREDIWVLADNLRREIPEATLDDLL